VIFIPVHRGAAAVAMTNREVLAVTRAAEREGFLEGRNIDL
jgi:hypothetical protein